LGEKKVKFTDKKYLLEQGRMINAISEERPSLFNKWGERKRKKKRPDGISSIICSETKKGEDGGGLKCDLKRKRGQIGSTSPRMEEQAYKKEEGRAGLKARKKNRKIERPQRRRRREEKKG